MIYQDHLASCFDVVSVCGFSCLPVPIARILLEDMKRKFLVEPTRQEPFIFINVNFTVPILIKHIKKFFNILVGNQFLMRNSTNKEFLEINFSIIIGINSFEYLTPFIAKSEDI